MMKIYLRYALYAFVCLVITQIHAAHAQEKTLSHIQITNTLELAHDDASHKIWGIEVLDPKVSVLTLKARGALEDFIADQPVLCALKGDQEMQCINHQEKDLSLFLLQQGYVLVNRTAVKGTIYESPYLEAERQAQKMERGLWANAGQNTVGGKDADSIGFSILTFFFIAALGIALMGFGFFIARTLKQAMTVQNMALELAQKERQLQAKDKEIFASMLYAEIVENKEKIDAYLTIYEETLKEFSGEDGAPKYLKSGDIIQTQPFLSRSIFDGNTHKLDHLGELLASDVIHYYARIKTSPDYVELTADMPSDQAWEIVQQAVQKARKLQKFGNEVLENIREHSPINRF